MTKTTYSDPSEGDTYSGYHSIEIVEDNKVVADLHLGPELMPDFDSPSDLRAFALQVAEFAEQMEDVEDGLATDPTEA